MGKSDLVEELRLARVRLAGFEAAEAGRERLSALRRERLRAAFDGMIERIWHFDRAGVVRDLNAIAAADLGLPASAVIGKHLSDLFPPATAARMIEDHDRVMASGKPMPRVAEEYIFHDGAKRWFQTDRVPYYNGKGEVDGVLVLAIDLTAHMQAEEALSTSQFQLSEAMDLASIVYWQLDPATDTFIFNDPFYAFYGTTADREGGYLMTREEYAIRFLCPEDLPAFRESSARRLSCTETEFLHELEHRIIRRDGQVRHVLARIRAEFSPDGRTIKCYGANQDITERKKAEEQLERERALKEAQLRRGKALEESREELRNLSEHLQRVRERERTRIAREVHDELGQFLSALKIDLTYLGQGLDSGHAGLLEQIRSTAARIDTAVHTVRKICSELRPSILDDFGLSAAIEWNAEDFQKRTGIRFVTRMDPTIPDMDKKLALVFFRIFQESVTNVVRHAEATTVKVSLKRDEGNVVLKVMDNGKGISKKALSSPGSLGIIGMRERVRFWNGQLQFRGAPNKGTTMIVSIPLVADGGRVKKTG
jgi:PAS domain S-box-containing protein